MRSGACPAIGRASYRFPRQALTGGTGLAYWSCEISTLGAPMGRILLGVVIGVILVIWLLASCVGAIF